MKRLSLITLQYINNYGSVLQTVASQILLEQHGCDVEIVNYTRENCRIDELAKTMRETYRSKNGFFKIPFVSSILVLRWRYLYQKRNDVFDEFRRMYVNLSPKYSSLKELYNNPPKADAYCVGSDQVWNYLYNGSILPEYYLTYAENYKIKFSLASSLGVEQIDDVNVERQMKDYLEEFDLITVRENSALLELQRMGIKNVYQILDPTLLVKKDIWISKFGLREKSQNYVLLYQLNPCVEMNQLAQKVAKELGCKLIIISNNIRIHVSGAKIIANPTVLDFLDLMYNASYIITDSFHGTAFSLNFNKEFISWVPPKYGTRIFSILELTGLLERACRQTGIEVKTMTPIDYETINKILEKERGKVDELIDNVLDV